MLIDHYETENYSDLDSEHIAHVVSDILYQNSLLLSPIVVGFDNDGKPSIIAMDELGIYRRTENCDKFTIILLT